MKLKTFQLGPTAHVLEQSPVASALWHPLGVNGNCLVTVTVDAIVRIWELDTKNRWSFDAPSTAVDLKKLVNGACSTEDFSPSKYGTSKGFSPDSFEMEVASACFQGFTAECANEGWGSMTLWVAMREGDIYALCPFLPSQFTLSGSSLSHLAASIACNFTSASSEESHETSKGEHQRQRNDQATWISDLMEQTKNAAPLYQRPMRPGPLPMLQGPFQITPDADQIFDITDMCIISQASNDATEFDDGLSSTSEAKSPLNLVCIATSEGNIHVCIDLDGIEARWLPLRPHGNGRLNHDTSFAPELLLVESLVINDSSKGCWPIFSPDPQRRSALFVTHDSGVSYADVSAWTDKLHDELNAYAESGVHLRADVLLQNAVTAIEHPIRMRPISSPKDELSSVDFDGCIALLDSDLGLFVLTSVDGEPRAVTLEESLAVNKHGIHEGNNNFEAADLMMPLHEPRPPYQPSKEFWTAFKLVEFVAQHSFNRNPRMMKEEIKFSPATLKVLMDVHRKLSQETHRLGQAAAELFRHCERLQVELRQQVKEVNTAAERIEAVLGEDEDLYDDDDIVGTAEQIEQRMKTSRERQVSLENRFTELRRKLSRLNGRPMNEKEKLWVTEIRSMIGMLDKTKTNDAYEELRQSGNGQLSNRLDELRKMRTQLMAETREHGDEANISSILGGQGVKSTVMVEIDAMLERQTALVDATRSKLEKLSLMSA